MVLVAVFLDNIDRDVAKEFRGNREPFCSTFLATIRLLKDRRLLLLIPMTIYSGLEQSYLWGEFTKVGNYGCLRAAIKPVIAYVQYSLK